MTLPARQRRRRCDAFDSHPFWDALNVKKLQKKLLSGLVSRYGGVIVRQVGGELPV